MEHPPKQGLKQFCPHINPEPRWVLMEHPPKQGLKQKEIEPYSTLVVEF